MSEGGGMVGSAEGVSVRPLDETGVMVVADLELLRVYVEAIRSHDRGASQAFRWTPKTI